jgi:hypothetical protein
MPTAAGYVVTRRADVLAAFACSDCDAQTCDCVLLAMREAKKRGEGTDVRRARDGAVLAIVRDALSAEDRRHIAGDSKFLGAKHPTTRRRFAFDKTGGER